MLKLIQGTQIKVRDYRGFWTQTKALKDTNFPDTAKVIALCDKIAEIDRIAVRTLFAQGWVIMVTEVKAFPFLAVMERDLGCCE